MTMLITDSDNRGEPTEPREDGNRHVAEAYENLRVIREVMDRSIKHSTLSGFSGILSGIWAILGALATRAILSDQTSISNYNSEVVALGAIWLAVVGLAIATDFVVTKSRAVRVGKQVFSKLGAQMVRAASPGFVAGMMITLSFVARHEISAVWPYWMVCYGLAICSVGQFSVRSVSALGWAFVAAGAVAFCLPASYGLTVVAASFGGLHIVYGLYTGITRRDW